MIGQLVSQSSVTTGLLRYTIPVLENFHCCPATLLAAARVWTRCHYITYSTHSYILYIYMYMWERLSCAIWYRKVPATYMFCIYIYTYTVYTHNLLLLLLKFGAWTIFCPAICLTLTSFCNGVGKDGSPWSCVVLHTDWMNIFKVEKKVQCVKLYILYICILYMYLGYYLYIYIMFTQFQNNIYILYKYIHIILCI